MQSSNRRALMLAAALLGVSSGLPAMPAARTVSPSTGTSQAPRRRFGPLVPFSSSRQDDRHAQRQYTAVVNGFEIMQTAPGKRRQAQLAARRAA